MKNQRQLMDIGAIRVVAQFPRDTALIVICVALSRRTARESAKIIAYQTQQGAGFPQKYRGRHGVT
jgi:hypothetical protein